MHTLKSGDVVLNLSTGCLMTLGDVIEGRAWCQWFEGNTLYAGMFPVDRLAFVSS